MKKFFGFIFFISLIIPIQFVQGASAFLVSDFIQDNNIFIGIFNSSGRTIRSFWAVSLENSNGINLASGDLDGDNKEEIIVIPNSGNVRVRIYTHEGENKFKDFFAYQKQYRGGANLALGDLNGDGNKEIIIAPIWGNLPIKVFDYQGNILGSSFYPFSKNHKGNLSLAAGDIDMDGQEEIIVGSGEGVEARVKIFNMEGKEYPINFSPFGKEYKGGVNIASGDIDGNGKDEILMCQRSEGSWCKIYDYSKSKQVLHQWHAFSQKDLGVRVNMADIDRDGREEIIALSKLKGNNIVKAFKNSSLLESIFDFKIPSGGNGNSNIDIFFDSQRDESRVIYVDDGDTIFLNNNREVRYIGIDTPEIEEDYYVEASNKNKDLVFEKEVELEYDAQRVDPYGRLLAYVYQDDEMINAKLVEEGLAKVKTFPPNEKYKELLKDKENLAKENKLGIWKNKEENKKFSFWDLLDFFKIFF